MALDILPNVTARSYGATATFGCYVAFFRYVRLLAYLQSLFNSNILFVVSGTGLIGTSFERTLPRPSSMTIS